MARQPQPGRREADATAHTDETHAGFRNYYVGTNGTTCSHALRGALGRDGYIAWLKGTLLAYNWRLGEKPDVEPLEDLDKMSWYQAELRRMLADSDA